MTTLQRYVVEAQIADEDTGWLCYSYTSTRLAHVLYSLYFDLEFWTLFGHLEFAHLGDMLAMPAQSPLIGMAT
jgi:hypothetical protein